MDMNRLRFGSAILASAALAASALAAKIPSYAVRGPPESLRLLNAAVGKCGYARHVRTAPGSGLDTMLVIDVANSKDPKFKCVWKWLDDHHDKNLSVNRYR
jgi:hypothetical protein